MEPQNKEKVLRYLGSFPPGYKFDPSDEELIISYLQPKINGGILPHNSMHDVNIYKYNPEQLAEKYIPQGNKGWYFFTPRDKKYRNGSRPDRKAGDGFWKATGADKVIKSGDIEIGFRKALVFYTGRPPNGSKTYWIMHEFKLAGPSQVGKRDNTSTDEDTSMRLDDYVLCRIYKKAKGQRRTKSQTTTTTNHQETDLDSEPADDLLDNETTSSDDSIPPPDLTNHSAAAIAVVGASYDSIPPPVITNHSTAANMYNSQYNFGDNNNNNNNNNNANICSTYGNVNHTDDDFFSAIPFTGASTSYNYSDMNFGPSTSSYLDCLLQDDEYYIPAGPDGNNYNSNFYFQGEYDNYESWDPISALLYSEEHPLYPTTTANLTNIAPPGAAHILPPLPHDQKDHNVNAANVKVKPTSPPPPPPPTPSL